MIPLSQITEPIIPPEWGTREIEEARDAIDAFIFANPDAPGDETKTRAAYLVFRYWRLISEALHRELATLDIVASEKDRQKAARRQGAIEFIEALIRKDSALGLSEVLAAQTKTVQERERAARRAAR